MYRGKNSFNPKNSLTYLPKKVKSVFEILIAEQLQKELFHLILHNRIRKPKLPPIQVSVTELLFTYSVRFKKEGNILARLST
jgi:hypothetical protein